VDAETLTYTRNSVMGKLLLEKDLFGALEPFRPVIDGNEFGDQPLNLFKSGQWQTHKELIVGINQEEMAQISAFFEDLGLPLPKAVFEVSILIYLKYFLFFSDRISYVFLGKDKRFRRHSHHAVVAFWCLVMVLEMGFRFSYFIGINFES